MTVSELVALISPAANIVVLGMVIPAMNRNRHLSEQLAVMQYQIKLLLQKNGIDVPDQHIPYGTGS